MRINVYNRYSDTPVRTNKFVRNAIEAESFCQWWKRQHGEEAYFVFVR